MRVKYQPPRELIEGRDWPPRDCLKHTREQKSSQVNSNMPHDDDKYVMLKYATAIRRDSIW